MRLLSFLLLIIFVTCQGICQVDLEEFGQVIERVIDHDEIYHELVKYSYHDTTWFPKNSIFIHGENTPYKNIDSLSYYKITDQNVYVMDDTNLWFFQIPYFIQISQYKVSSKEIILGLNTKCLYNYCDSLNQINANFTLSRKRLKIIDEKIEIK